MDSCGGRRPLAEAVTEFGNVFLNAVVAAAADTITQSRHQAARLALRDPIAVDMTGNRKLSRGRAGVIARAVHNDSRSPLTLIVAVRNGVCTGCHMILPAQFANIVREGENINFCPYCSRILYYEEVSEDQQQDYTAMGVAGSLAGLDDDDDDEEEDEESRFNEGDDDEDSRSEYDDDDENEEDDESEESEDDEEESDDEDEE